VLTQLPDDPLEDGECAVARMHRAGLQHGGDEVARLAVKDQQGWDMCCQ
jgi:hypothetical protein